MLCCSKIFQSWLAKTATATPNGLQGKAEITEPSPRNKGIEEDKGVSGGVAAITTGGDGIENVQVASNSSTAAKRKDPKKPKRPKFAKTYYSNKVRPDIKAANPDLSTIEVNKIVADNFKALSAEERAPYEAEAAADKERYEKEMEEYRKE